MSLLKVLAPSSNMLRLNMPDMSVTRPVFHLEMSALNCALFLNRSSMSVTRLTSQHGISVAPAPVPATPQSAPAAQQPTPEATLPTHASTAALSFVLSANCGLGSAQATGAGVGVGVGVGAGVGVGPGVGPGMGPGVGPGVGPGMGPGV